MLSLRVKLLVLALVATPFVAGVAQGRGNSKPKPRANALAADESSCNADQAAEVARARAEGRPVPPGLEKKNCEGVPVTPPAPVPPPPTLPPPPSSPPVGPHEARGIVFEDLDGNGVRDPFAGEMGLAGWGLELWWNGQVLATTTTDVDGNFVFPSLGNSTYSVCVVAQGGYRQTLPIGGSGCGGAGYTFSFNSQFMTWSVNNFGMMLQ